MKIKKLRIKNNYKRFHDLTIDLGDNPKRIVALVGPNGCGKSSVLDAIIFHAGAYERIGNTTKKGFAGDSPAQEVRAVVKSATTEYKQRGLDKSKEPKSQGRDR